MKRILSLVIVLALVLCMMPAVFAEAQQTMTLVPGENPVTLVPDTNYTLRLNLGALDKPAGTMTWSGDVTVTVNGVATQSPYDLTKYAPKTQIIATVQAETDVNFVITLPEEEKPFALILGENAIDVPQGYSGKLAEFTATEAGEYMLGLAEGEENAYVSYFTHDTYGNEVLQNVELPYTLMLDAGETAKFNISALDNQADTINLVMERLTDVYKHLEFGTTKLTLLPNTNYNLRLALEPSGTISWDNAAVTVMVDGLEVTSPAKIEEYSRWMTVVATVEAKTVVSFTLEEEKIVLPEMKLGENHIEVPSGFGGVDFVFTAPEAGNYILQPIAGEENAYVSVEIGYAAESGVTLPYVMALEKGTQVKINISPNNSSADTIDLLFFRGCFHTPDTMTLSTEAVAAGDHTAGVKALYHCLDCGLIYDAQGNKIQLENGLDYIILPNHTAVMEDVAEVPATEEADGMKAHVFCTQCSKYFVLNESSETVEGIINEVTRESLIIPKLQNYTLGDVNGDNRVNILDVMAIINFITGQLTLSDSEFMAADLAKDGQINIFDAMALISVITG